MSEKTIVSIVGLPGAGKSEASKYLQVARGFSTFLVSDFIRSYANDRGISLRERRDYANARTQMLKELGEHAITDAVLELPSGIVCVDGIRTLGSMRSLQAVSAQFIALDCPPEIRHERSLLRKRDLDKTSFDDFRRDELAEVETQAVIEAADHHIDSSRPLAAVTIDLDNIVSSLLAS